MSEKKPKSALAEVLQHWLSSCLDTTEPPSKTPEDLQTDSRTFFRYLSKNTQVITNDVVLQTKSSHEEALAQLVQDIGPAFTQEHHRARLRALYVLTGAIDGCKEARLSNRIIQLLGQFLLGHCGPVDDDTYEEDYDTMIRDAAILALSSLVSISTSNSQTDEELAEAIMNRMNLARTAINRRCALPENEDKAPDPYGFGGAASDIRGGLSTLPRSKRAMCFDLLQKTIRGIAPVYKQMQEPTKNELVLSNLQSQMVEFARFTANCLQGESDPRCLQQLLKIIHNLQVALAPWFAADSSSSEAIFPTEDIFDAVAPYYPIQFSPPPNDIHGITREGLHKALLSVLTFTKVDPGVAKFNRQPMMTLSVDLFLETLLPAPEDDNPGPLDKLEALECLSSLLFPEPGSRTIDQMETRIVTSLSQALKATHDEASLGVAQGGQMGSENKNLADYCRTFVSKVAFALEQSPNIDLWKIFVNQTLQRLSPKLKSSPSTFKTSIAYIACLTSSGGPRTLRACLAMGLQPLIDFLEERMGNDENTSAAAYGIGAFCSSCRVAMERATEQGVVLHPHPLETYSEKIASVLLVALDRDDLSTSIRVGATRGLECLLVAGGAGQLSDETIGRICAFLDKLSSEVLDDSPGEKNTALIDAYSTALGNIIAAVLNKSPKFSNTLLHSPKLEEHVARTIYPSLLSDVETPQAMMKHSGLKVLSIASFSSFEVAQSIMTSCLEMLVDSFSQKGVASSFPSAQAVAYLLTNGGAMAVRAFHRCEAVDTILTSFNDYAKSRTKEEIRNSFSNLGLPDTVEEREAFKKEVDVVKRISVNFLPAFKESVPRERLMQLLKMVSDILPPLSHADSFRLCVWLPILAEALHATPDEEDDETVEMDDSVGEIATTLIRGLTDVATTSDFDAETRSAAGSCLYAVIILSKASKDCLVAPIVSYSIAPTLSTTVDATAVQNALKILALLGSAAAARGGMSSSTADRIAIFLLEVACDGKAELPFSQGAQQNLINSQAFEDEKIIQLSAASAYGSMVTVSTLKPLMKQRLMYASFKFIKAAYNEERDQARTGQTVKAPRVGLLAVVCHVICNSDFSRLERSMLHQLCTLVVEGLSSSIFQSAKESNQVRSTTASKNLVLAATLKAICIAPTVVSLFPLHCLVASRESH